MIGQASRIAAFVVLAGLSTVVPSLQVTDAQENLSSTLLYCFPPDDPFPYKLSKSDPLYDAARGEHQAHLEAMEDYVNCLDRERAAAFALLQSSYDLFMENFGRDAVFRYPVEAGR